MDETSSLFQRNTVQDVMGIYKKDATSVVFFKIVYANDDFTSKDGRFNPAMAHQIFGEEESIFGYRSLTINLYYHHNSSFCYVDIQKSTEFTREECKPDDIMKSLEPFLPEYTTRESEFIEVLRNEKHDVMYGTVLNEFEDKLERKFYPDHTINVKYKITKCDIEDENFRKLHSRFETYIYWFIDGGSTIDLSDSRWMMYYVYEEFQHPVSKEIYRSPAGYCSVYRFYAHPFKTRARISQFLILPPHQKRGVGTQLYNTIAEDIKTMADIVDITVEEPTSQFKKLRDYKDCVDVYKDMKEAGMCVSSTCKKSFTEFVNKHKICKRQSDRIYDILKCYEAIISSQTEYKNVLHSIKNKIASDVEKETSGNKKCKYGKPFIVLELKDKIETIDADYKKYIKDIEPSVMLLKQNFKL